MCWIFFTQGYWRISKARNRFFFLFAPRFSIELKIPLLSEEGWSSIKKSADSERKNASCCWVCTGQSQLVFCRELQELRVWQLWTQTHRVQGDVWSSHCLIEGRMLCQEEENSLSSQFPSHPCGCRDWRVIHLSSSYEGNLKTPSGKHFSLTIRAFKAKSNKNLQFSKLLIFFFFFLASQKGG